MHAALLTALTASGSSQSRARRVASGLYWIVCITLLIALLEGAGIKLLRNVDASEPSLAWLLPLTVTLGLFGLRLSLSVRLDLWAFFSSTLAIAGLLSCVAVERFPLAAMLGISF
jgi:cytochrome bd-type quinol oxidase subunit 2